ncbi:MAG TPA: hydantoinase/oxoprolinase family protein [bacterium]|nr:hydantoinase/oxoprolinase family protein [bacterium]
MTAAPRSARGSYRVGLDIGGTFTDLVLLNETTGELRLHKILTTPEDPARAALAGLLELCGEAGVPLGEVAALIHGTTLVTNAIIERRGARTALLTTRGFRDILEMGKEQRYDIYDLFLRFPEPLVRRLDRREIDERIAADGEVLEPLDREAVRRVAERLAADGIEAVAVAFLHAYRNPANEQAALAAIRAAAPGLAVSLSSDVVPEIREFERTCTTVCNAYVQPLLDRYIGRLESTLGERGFAGRFTLMQSTGGAASPETARRFPIRLLESGPAGGALVAAFFGGPLGFHDLVGFDMGGTTAKICLIRDGRTAIAPEMEVARVHRFKRGSGLPVTVPTVDMMEVGAGGGSIAWIDTLGLLKVGPHSAGAEPGPACYGRGGQAPTVTDACLALGYFNEASFLGGTMPLDRTAALEALERLGAPLHLDAIGTAWGIHQIVVESMAAAARVYLIERGQDPRRFALIAFGGAGPSHAARLARILGMADVVVPPASGVASALGLLVAPVSVDLVHSLPGPLNDLPWDRVTALYEDMETQGLAALRDAGVAPGFVVRERRVEMRLLGQFHDIEIPVPDGPLGPGAADGLARAFEAEYRRRYGIFLADRAIQALNWRVSVTGPRPDVRLQTGAAGGASLALGLRREPEMPAGSGAAGRPASDGKGVADAAAAVRGRRPAYFPEMGGFVEVPVYDRGLLRPGMRAEGPAIIEEREATTVTGPGDRCTVDATGNLRLAVARHSRQPAVPGGRSAHGAV